MHWKSTNICRCPPLPKPPIGARRVLELGSGWGEWLCQWLQIYPKDMYLAFETNFRRIRRTLRQLSKQKTGKLEILPTSPLANLRIAPLNYQWFLQQIVGAQQFDMIFILFPDPWPKRKHHKNRFIQGDFAAYHPTAIETKRTVAGVYCHRLWPIRKENFRISTGKTLYAQCL